VAILIINARGGLFGSILLSVRLVLPEIREIQSLDQGHESIRYQIQRDKKACKVAEGRKKENTGRKR
jgi:hypothetical protein